MNAYLSVLEKNQTGNLDIDTAGLKLKYAAIDREAFQREYSAKGWLGRKCLALPAAIWSGTVLTIYHLARTILVSIVSAFSGHVELKLPLFYLIRDLQTSFGWLATLFNDRCGRYHRQDSRFHRTCYECTFTDFTFRTQSEYRALAFVKKYPTLLGCLSSEARNNGDVVVAGLEGCHYPEQAQQVWRNVGRIVKVYRPVNLALVKKCPALFKQLNKYAQNDENVAVAALKSCRSVDQAQQVWESAGYKARASSQVIFALEKTGMTRER